MSTWPVSSPFTSKLEIHPLTAMHKESAWLFSTLQRCYTLFRPLSHTDIYSYRKCACPASRSHRNQQAVHIETSKPFTSKPASCSHRRRALVHIDSRERIACSTRSYRELHPVSTGKCTLCRGEKKKRKSLDFSRLFRVGGRNRTRTCDPIDVNDVLYQLSHATIRDFYEVTSRYYQLSHATLFRTF